MTRNLRRHLDIEVSAEIPFQSKAAADAAMNALIPDNVNLPRGLSIKLLSRGSTLVVEIAGRNIPAGTVLGTLDEVLEHISVAKKVISG